MASLSTRRSELPLPLTTLVGRASETAIVVMALRRADVRLVTLTGPGGVGKTRLAIQVAADLKANFAQGVVWVPLGAVRDPDLVVATMAHAFGVPESTTQDPIDGLIATLRDRQLLLVLDNFEHVLESAPVLVEILAACRDLKILVTSRALLRISGEHDIPVPPLAVPAIGAPIAQLGESDAVRLFVERAEAVNPSFTLTPENVAAVSAICRRLDGLPLAVELAAAKTRLLPPEALLTGIAAALPLLEGGARDQPDRLRTMRNTIGWSFDLLAEEEQRFFCALGVFVGGFTLDAAAAVGGMGSTEVFSPLEELATHSLVIGLGTIAGEPRFTMLETVREFALEQLTARGEEEPARMALITWLIGLADSTRSELFFGPKGPFWLSRYDAELGNIRAAMAWLLETGDPLTALRLLVAYDDYWSARRYRAESLRWAEFGLSQAPDAPADLRATALHIAVFSARALGNFRAAIAYAEEGLDVAQELGNPVVIGRAYYQLGNAWHHVDAARAREASINAVAAFRQTNDRMWLGVMLADLGDKMHSCGDAEAAASLIDEGLAICREIENTWGVAQALGQRAHVARSLGDPTHAQKLFAELIPIAQDIGDEHMVMGAVAGLAGVALDWGQAERAARLLGAVATEQEATGWPRVAHPLNAARIVADVRAALGEEAYTAACARGRAMPFDQALADALAIARGVDGSASGQLRERPRFGLTSREFDVLRLLVNGHSDREIARILNVSPRTVGVHVTGLLAKFGVENRTAAAAQAIRHGLV